MFKHSPRREAYWPRACAAGLLLATGCQCSSDGTARLFVADDGGAGDGAPAARPDAAGGIEAGKPDARAEASVEDSGRDDGGTTAPDGGGPDAAFDAGRRISLYCGDGVRGLDEQCDDGNLDESDFCSTACRVLDRAALALDNTSSRPAKRRAIAGGHHVVAGTDRSSVVLIADTTESPASLRAGLYRPSGNRVTDDGVLFSEGKPPYEPTEASVVALPRNRYALAWTTQYIDGDGLGIALRGLDGKTGELGVAAAANSVRQGAQESVDAVWAGEALVLAWTDRSDVFPRVKLQRFNADLQAMGFEERLAPDDGAQGEAQPILTEFAGSFGALWVESYEDFTAAIRVRAADVSWTIPMATTFTGDEMRLAALDDSHLFAVWTQNDYVESTGLDVARLYGAVLDTSVPGIVEPFRIEARSAVLAADPTRRMRRPALAVAGGVAFLAWFANTSFGGDGTPALVIKEMPWHTDDAGLPSLDLSREEVPLARSAARAADGAQDAPALGLVPWTSGGSLFAVWEDGSRTFGPSQRRPDVVAHVVPLPVLRITEGESHDF